MQIKAIIDRLEDETAILLAGEPERSINWPKALLPANAREGDILEITLAIDKEATRQVKDEMEALLRQILDQQADR